MLAESVQVPLLWSWEPSKASNKLYGEFVTKAFTQNMSFKAVPASGSWSTITSTVVDSSGQGFGNKFWVYV